MFDTVGIVDDPGRRRRQVQSVLITTVLLTLVGVWVVVEGSSVGPPLAVFKPPHEELVEVTLEPPGLPTSPDAPHAPTAPTAPTAPAMPASSASTSPAEPADSPGLSAADGADVSAAPLEAAPTEPSPAVEPEASPLGGVLAGPPGGWSRLPAGETRAAGSPALPEARAVDNGSVQLRRRVDPVYPASEHIRTSCRAEIRIDEDGRPALVQVGGCPAIFAMATREAVKRWRWSKPMVNGRRMAVRTTYTVHYEPER